MYLICYGTRPELIKLFPLMCELSIREIPFKTLFSGQHIDLYKQFQMLLPEPDYMLINVMRKGQSLNELSSKILIQMDEILKIKDLDTIIIQGDTTTAYSIALSAFHNKKKIIHLEAGLRTNNKYSPFPEEMNRVLISKLTDIHLCPTQRAVNNLKKEGIINNVYLVGNTIVEAFDLISTQSNKFSNNENYILVTLHRRENRGKKMRIMWRQLNKLADKGYKFKYIIHPSITNYKSILSDKIHILQPQNYLKMVNLINNSVGIITDSGGLQEEAVCAGKKVLICRNTTERLETIESGYGKLVDFDIENNIEFLFQKIEGNISNPYGEYVCKKIVEVL